MEAKLAQYRAEKAKHYKSTKSSLFQSFTESTFFRGKQNQVNSDENLNDKDLQTENNPEESTLHDVSNENRLPQTQAYKEEKSRQIILIERGLKILLWLVLWGLFIELQFGAVYFIVSVIFFVYINTRTGPKEKNKLSAYSVFNPNFEKLDGQFTSEQFEKELRFGAGSVH